MPIKDKIQADYRILLSRGDCRPVAHLYAFTIREEIPPFPLPLQQGDGAVSVELQALLTSIYDRTGFDLALDYAQPPVPALKADDTAWADVRLKGKGLR